MTLAALSPLFIWWPIALVTLALIVTAARRIWPPQLLAAVKADPWGPPEPWTRQG